MSERSRKRASARDGRRRPVVSRSVSRKSQGTRAAQVQRARMALDGYNNLIARLGDNERNALSSSYYAPRGLSNRWQELTVMYREGWLTKKIIDVPAEDMTKAWISFDTQLEQDAVRRIEREFRQFKVQKKFTDGLKWGRLYGGAIGVILIDGQEDMMHMPLDLALVMPGSFRGMIIKDRWAGVNPSLELVTDLMDSDYGYPKYYEIEGVAPDSGNALGGESIKVHHSRVVRFTGRELPFLDEQAELYWGASEMEHVFDELNKRNATSANIAQLVFQANLRVLKMSDLGQLLAMSDERTQKELYATIQAQNTLMTSFGLQLMDSEDSFETHPYTFAGLNDIYQSFQADISGAAEIPATKLFGKSPDGMNATGESDLTNYYDSIRQKQENYLRPGLEKVLPVACVSALGKMPDDIEIVFEPVETTTDVQRAELAGMLTTAISTLFQSDLYSKGMALKELRKASYTTGVGSVITDEDIEAAEEEAQLMAEQNAGMEMMGGGMPGMPGVEQPQEQVPGQPGQPGMEEQQPTQDDMKSAAIESIRGKISSIEKLRESLYVLEGSSPKREPDEDEKKELTG